MDSTMRILCSIIALASVSAVVSETLEQSCHQGPRYVLNATEGQGFSSCLGNITELNTDTSPFDIVQVSPDGSSVSFKINMDFAGSAVSKIGVQYFKSDTEIVCDIRSNDGFNWTSPEDYTADCDANGKAEVKVYLYLCDRPTDVCYYCERPPGSQDDYYELTYELRCQEPCPTSMPTASPTVAPSIGPTFRPTLNPTLSPSLSPTNIPSDRPPSGSLGDPHFKTWKNEHFEYHGQCDLILMKDDHFAGGLGIEVQIRTKLVRFWSYIKSAAIRIGDDVLEVQGTADPDARHVHYWFNLEYQGKLDTLGGFPLKMAGSETVKKRTFEVDLRSIYPHQKIIISAFNEFIKVDFENGSEASFGNSVGMLGNFVTGETFARDGVTVINDFSEFGNEWQVLPMDDMLFHSVEQPQFPKRCLEPEDPRGQRRRRLEESTITEEDAEIACSILKDFYDRKDCVYDILATQDIDIVGAY